MRLQLDRFESPVSTLLIVTDEQGVLRALDFADHEARMFRLLNIHYGPHDLERGPAPAPITRALQDYFEGNMDALSDVHIATSGTTFQREVWKALRNIPAGQTMAYGQLAEQLGRAGASRAVGAANGSNPIAIVVPCHRVVGANGALTGFAGGLARKRWLLDHESRSFAVGHG
ncbi:MAG TPA: methylated-DNA--[protein]-cysteine S-methyltransferase [Tepidisphaeraceae bacterium]|nr:methylated-DNA--[protein]-cysteine S-methyltransferase [Tepidisphaeraceae bacterium]